MAAIAGAFDPRFVVLSVRSPIQLGQYAFGWFHVRFTPEGRVIDLVEAEAAWRRIPGFIDEAVAEYNADPEQVYIAGFSQGGIMALAVILTAPEKLAGVVCMSGRLMPEVLPHAAAHDRLYEKPVLIVHGRQDDRLGVENGRWALETLRQFPLAVGYREFDMPHTTTDESVAFVAGWLSELLDKR